MTTGTRDDVRIPISEEPEDREWLYKIIEEPDRRGTSKPLIQEVAQTLRGITRNESCFDPSVVSFGPYHRRKDHFKPMERYKEVAARWFIKLSDNPVHASGREEAKQVYDDFIAQFPSVSSLRDCYTDKFVDTINDADFMRMMFVDGCFVLYFIQLFLDQSGDLLDTSHLNRPLILRDMFLLENQIPYSVLVALRSLKPTLMPGESTDDWAASFFKTVLLPPPLSFVSISRSMILLLMILIYALFPVYLFLSAMIILICALFMLLCALVLLLCWIVEHLADLMSKEGTDLPASQEGTDLPASQDGTDLPASPLHLLDLLQSELTGKGVDPTDLSARPFDFVGHFVDLFQYVITGKRVDPSVQETRYCKYNFRPISELKAAGILVKASNSESLSLNNIKIEMGWIDSYLELPRIIIDHWTKTRLLNLAAYEMCPGGSLGQPVITSYICFLNSLIYNADDVKELRSSNIMLNRLGSDEEVVNLFRELAANLSPDFNAYSNVTHGMELHSERLFNRPRMWIGQFKRTYFTTPWTAISLTAASSLIFLTLVQTIYGVLSYYKCNK